MNLKNDFKPSPKAGDYYDSDDNYLEEQHKKSISKQKEEDYSDEENFSEEKQDIMPDKPEFSDQIGNFLLIFRRKIGY